MNCKRALKSLLRLDNHQVPDGALRNHLHSCVRCRAEYDRLREMVTGLQSPPTAHASPSSTGDGPAETALQAPDSALSERIMAAVRKRADELAAGEAQVGHQRARSWAGYGKWVASGTLIMFGMMTLPYSAVVDSLRQLPGSRIDVTLAVAFGLILSAFIGTFIASHLEHLSRLLRRDSAS